MIRDGNVVVDGVHWWRIPIWRLLLCFSVRIQLESEQDLQQWFDAVIWHRVTPPLVRRCSLFIDQKVFNRRRV